MHNASVIKSVAKSVETIKLGIALGDLKKCQSAYRFARQYNPDLPEASEYLSVYPNVVKVLEARLSMARAKLEAKKALWR